MHKYSIGEIEELLKQISNGGFHWKKIQTKSGIDIEFPTGNFAGDWQLVAKRIYEVADADFFIAASSIIRQLLDEREELKKKITKMAFDSSKVWGPSDVLELLNNQT